MRTEVDDSLLFLQNNLDLSKLKSFQPFNSLMVKLYEARDMVAKNMAYVSDTNKLVQMSAALYVYSEVIRIFGNSVNEADRIAKQYKEEMGIN